MHLDFKWLSRFLLFSVPIALISIFAFDAAQNYFVDGMKIAAANGASPSPSMSPTMTPTPTDSPMFNCQPGKQSASPNQSVGFSTSSNDPNAVWNAPGGSPSSGTGAGFQTSFSSPGNYRVWASDNSTSCFVHVVDPNPQPSMTPYPTPTNYPVYKPDYKRDFDRRRDTDRKDYFPDDRRMHSPDSRPIDSRPYQQPRATPTPSTEVQCPGGWEKQTHGVAVVCVPSGNGFNQMPQIPQPQNQNQNQNQNNNQSTNNNVNVVSGGGSSSSSSSSAAN